MDILTISSIILGIMGLTLLKIKKTFKFLLCCCTSYFMIKLINHNIYVWNLKDWQNVDNYKIFFESIYCKQSVIFILLSYLLFYIFIPKKMEKLFNKYISEIIKKSIEQIGESGKRAVSIYFISRSVKFYFKTKFSILKKPTEKINELELNVDSTKSNLIDEFSMFFHLVICWLILQPLNNKLLSFLLIFSVFFLLFFIVAMPILKPFIENAKKTIISEHNKYVE